MTENEYVVRARSSKHKHAILDGIWRLITGYGVATIEDLKTLAKATPVSGDCDYGWVNLPTVTILAEYPDGAVDLAFPRPVPLGGPKTEPKEMVDHPDHYQSKTGLEAWDVIKAFTSNLTGIEAFDTGNVLKYMCRWKGKNGLEDLKKAKRYLEHLIDHVENSKKGE